MNGSFRSKAGRSSLTLLQDLPKADFFQPLSAHTGASGAIFPSGWGVSAPPPLQPSLESQFLSGGLWVLPRSRPFFTGTRSAWDPAPPPPLGPAPSTRGSRRPRPRRPRPRQALCSPSCVAASGGHTGARRNWRRQTVPFPFSQLLRLAPGPGPPGRRSQRVRAARRRRAAGVLPQSFPM